MINYEKYVAMGRYTSSVLWVLLSFVWVEIEVGYGME